VIGMGLPTVAIAILAFVMSPAKSRLDPDRTVALHQSSGRWSRSVSRRGRAGLGPMLIGL